MIRLDQRNADVQGTERVFKKVVHGGHNALRFVDKNGLPLRPPNTATLSRLHSTYVLSPRGVPTRKSNHSYSGQLTQAKMQQMVNSLETSSQEMASYTSMHSYHNGTGLSSAGSSRHYLSTANSQKHRTFGPARSAKTMNKSASSQRTHRMLVSAPGLEITNNDPNAETTNDSPQGKRLEKEWSAMSQCRALKRSSEIVGHRVDRMYFMTGNKLKLQAKYHVEDDDLHHLRELQAARASSRSSRSGRSKGDVYRPHSLKTDLSNGDLEFGLVVSDEARRADRRRVENGHKENRDPKVVVSQKMLTPRPHSSNNNKSPIQGWADDASEKATIIANGIPNDTLHDNGKDLEGTETARTDAIDHQDNEQGDSKENGDKNIEAGTIDNQKVVNETKDIEGNTANSNPSNTEKDNVDNKVTVDIDDLVVVTGKNIKDLEKKVAEEIKGNSKDDEKSVQKTEGTSEENEDKDQTDVKSEDYLGK